MTRCAPTGTTPGSIHVPREVLVAVGNPIEVNEMTLDASAYVLRYDFEA